MAATPVKKGTLLLNRYRIAGNKPIGSGGAGEIYLVRDIQLNRDCVAKILRPDRCKDRAFTVCLRQACMTRCNAF
jgi:hypothetical protein